MLYMLCKHIQSVFMLHEMLQMFRIWLRSDFGYRHTLMMTLKTHLLKLDKRVLDYTQALYLYCSSSLQITIFSLGGYNL